MARKKKTPYQRIMRAHENGTGVRLTYDDVFLMGLDDAIATRASNDDEAGEGIAAEDYSTPKVSGHGKSTTIVWMEPQRNSKRGSHNE